MTMTHIQHNSAKNTKPLVDLPPGMDVKVTKINDRWHARLLNQTGDILDEMACDTQSDIGWICREMMRWQDKGGNFNSQTIHARANHEVGPQGKIWYQVHLTIEKAKRRG
jgi:hypothetical protein